MCQNLSLSVHLFKPAREAEIGDLTFVWIVSDFTFYYLCPIV